MTDGTTVMERNGRSRSPDEIAELWSYLKRRLTRDKRTVTEHKRTAKLPLPRERAVPRRTAANKTRRAPTKKAA